jgi:hypothetical protein
MAIRRTTWRSITHASTLFATNASTEHGEKSNSTRIPALFAELEGDQVLDLRAKVLED